MELRKRGRPRLRPVEPINPFKGQKELKINLGCGDKRINGYVNVDKFKSDESVCLVNLEEAKLPFDDESCKEVFADNVMEHINNLLPLMNEIWRVLRHNGLFYAIVPVYPWEGVFQDPTHVRVFTQSTWAYFTEDQFLYQEVGKNYGIKPFRVLDQVTDGKFLKTRLIK